jgi:hypothetical protein
MLTEFVISIFMEISETDLQLLGFIELSGLSLYGTVGSGFGR